MLCILTFNETSPSAPGTAASSQFVSTSAGPPGVATQQLDDYQAVSIEANLIGATGGTLDVYVQISTDMGTTWYDYVHYTQLANGASAISYVSSCASGAQNLSLATIGKNLNPALAAGTAVGGAWGDRFRLVMVAGSGTTVGAPVQVRIIGQRMFPWGSRGGSSSGNN